jgi:hypothetical protein
MATGKRLPLCLVWAFLPRSIVAACVMVLPS